MQPPELNMSEGKGTVPSVDVGEQEACPENQQDRPLLGLAVKLRQRLMPFQRQGVRFALAKDGRCMIADEMGLGKTLQAISVAYLYREEWPLLIVVPSSLKYPWIEEMEKWVPELNPGDINLVENKMDVSAISRSKVTILGYGLLTTDAQVLVDSLTRQSFRVVIVDESHYLKSRNAARSKILVPLIQKAKRAILLTGTPALGRPEELFMQIDALYPRKFGTWTDYAKKYCNAHYRFFGNRRQWDCRGASNLEELHQRLNEIMIRRLKSQVLTQLPPKIRQRIPFDLPKDGAKEAQASFEEWERLMKRLDSGAASEDASFAEVMSLITRMYKQTAIAKAGAVKDYIRMMLDNERLKFLVFAHHLTMLQACTEAVIEAKARYIRIDGSVPSAERIHLVHQFQNDPETRVAILSIQAAGQGLTFTAASHVVFAELYWNPGHIKQAEDRAHRIGQTSSVHIHYLIAKGTFDTIMWGMLNRKEGVTGSTLNGRRDYLKADIGDKDKWDFLNFAHAWTPSEALGREVKDHDDVLFSHFERDRQHDIRKFFSPNSSKEKKRRRKEEDSSPLPMSETEEDQGDRGVEEGQGRRSEGDTGDGLEGPEEDQDFAPLSKKIRGASPQLPSGRKRRSGLGSASPLVFRRLSEGIQAPPAVVVKDWSCGACTYTNSALLPYCEMCATPRFEKAGSSGFDRSGSRIDGSARTGPGSSGPDMAGGVGLPLAPRSPCLVISSSDEEADPSPSLALPAPRREDSEELGGEGESPKERCEGAHSLGSTAPDRHADESICDSADSGLPLYESLQFCASYNSDRIHLFTKEGIPLNCNFIPMDIKLDIWDDLPEAFGRQENRRQVQRFVREWSSLTSTKQRVVRRSGRLFHSPVLTLNDLTSAQRRQSITKRFLTKEDVAQASMTRAQQEGGTVRTVTRETFFAKRTPAKMADSTLDKGQGGRGSPPQTGYLQAVDSGGNPLCLSCQQPCGPAASWDGRFCGRACQEEFQVRSSQSYMRMRVLEAERGVCQTCGLNAHQLFLSVRDAPPTARKEMLENTWLSQLSLKELNEMIRNPVEGQFWQVDHIRPVYSGGGQCSLDNLQTLCTVCHKERTSLQAKERSQMKKGLAASKVASDITRFLIKK